MQAEWRARRLKNEKVHDHSQGRAIYSKPYTGKCKTQMQNTNAKHPLTGLS
jgi:hypothetical protein